MAGLLGVLRGTGPGILPRGPQVRKDHGWQSDLRPLGVAPRTAEEAEAGPYAERIESEARLPWWDPYPERLAALRRRHGAGVLMAAFRVTLPDPLPGEEYNVQVAASRLAGVVVMPGQVFSQNRTLGPYTAQRGYREGPTYRGSEVVRTVGGGVCKVATTLYNVATYAHLPVVERHPHSMRVPYVPPGRDATVTYEGGKDLRFRNTLRAPVVLWAASTPRDHTLYVALYGPQPPPRVRWEHQVLDRSPFRRVRKPNPRLRPGEERVVVSGLEGVTVRTWVVVEWPDGRVERQDRGVDRYRPLDEVVEYGPPEPSKGLPGSGGEAPAVAVGGCP